MAAPSSMVAHLATSATEKGTSAHVIHYGMLGVALAVVLAVGVAHLCAEYARPSSPGRRMSPGLRGEPGTTRDLLTEQVVLPVALVSSVAAAGVHAAMAPPHFREGAAIGLFFVVVSVLQMVWALLLAARRTVSRLAVGVLLNGAVLAVWALSRTLGLPLAFHDGPEAVGAWDVACGMWEGLVVAACAVMLRRTSTSGSVASWQDWHRSARAYAGGSVLLLAVLAAGGLA